MKKPTIFKASGTLLGILLLVSMLGTFCMTSFTGFMELSAACKSQWSGFSESFFKVQPHRTMFP